MRQFYKKGKTVEKKKSKFGMLSVKAVLLTLPFLSSAC